MKLLIFISHLVYVTAMSEGKPDYLVSYNVDNLHEQDVAHRFTNQELLALVENLPKTMAYLGQTLDGKVVFMDNTTRLTWQESREYCRSLNLRPMSIKSQEQQNFLMLELPAAVYTEYWTSAREHRLQHGFTWDEDWDNSPRYFSNWGVYAETYFPYKLCVALLRSNDAYNGIGVARECTDTKYTLCEAFTA